MSRSVSGLVLAVLLSGWGASSFAFTSAASSLLQYEPSTNWSASPSVSGVVSGVAPEAAAPSMPKKIKIILSESAPESSSGSALETLSTDEASESTSAITPDYANGMPI